MRIERFAANPLLAVDAAPGLGGNLNGPSVIRVPRWLPRALGRYYMYFAHHQGTYIRLAYADRLEGPWTVHAPGALHLDDTPCHGHIASPDAHVDERTRTLSLYYHGPALARAQYEQDELYRRFPYLYGQRTLWARSADGLRFASGRRLLGPSYFRYFRWQGQGYALGMPGLLYRQLGSDPEAFQAGPALFGPECRHFAVSASGDALRCYFTRAGDAPERILRAEIDTARPWREWRAKAVEEVMRPTEAYEGVGEPLVPSARGAMHGPARQLRDPCIFEEDGQAYLFYAVAGEQGIAGARLTES